MIRALLVCLCLAPLACLAQPMYKWVDEKGVTHFSEYPPPEGTKGASKIEVKTPTPDRAPTDNWREREAQAREQRAKQGVLPPGHGREEFGTFVARGPFVHGDFEYGVGTSQIVAHVDGPRADADG